MKKILSELEFTGENADIFDDFHLPTLDTALWSENNHVLYSFFEKPTRGNKVLQKSTALNSKTITSSLRQETIRRLSNISYNVTVKRKR